MSDNLKDLQSVIDGAFRRYVSPETYTNNPILGKGESRENIQIYNRIRSTTKVEEKFDLMRRLWSKAQVSSTVLSMSKMPEHRYWLYMNALLDLVANGQMDQTFMDFAITSCLNLGGLTSRPTLKFMDVESDSDFWKMNDDIMSSLSENLYDLMDSYNLDRFRSLHTENLFSGSGPEFPRTNFLYLFCNTILGRDRSKGDRRFPENVSEMTKLAVRAIASIRYGALHANEALKKAEADVTWTYRDQKGPLFEDDYLSEYLKLSKSFYTANDATGPKLAQQIILDGSFADCPVLADCVEENEGSSELAEYLREAPFINYGSWAIDLCRGVRSFHLYRNQRYRNT